MAYFRVRYALFSLHMAPTESGINRYFDILYPNFKLAVNQPLISCQHGPYLERKLVETSNNQR